MSGRPLGSVVVAGGGIVGWSAAAALKRRAPALDVTILPLPPGPEALAEQVTATLPSIVGLHADLGISDEDAVLRTGSAYRLGTRFAGWVEGRGDYVHAYGPVGCPLPAGSFHLGWIGEARRGDAPPPFDSFSAAATLARLGRFAPPADASADPFGGYGHGLTLDLDRYRAMMRAFAAHCGVRERPGELVRVRVGDDGRVAALMLADGGELAGDLFLDCTGPAALLRSALGGARDDWREWLPCDRVLFGAAAPAEPSPLDRVTAWGAGWRWASHGAGRTICGVVYAAAHASDDEAVAELRVEGATPTGPPVTLAASNWREPWHRNCVAIGEAATVVDPLEWTNLHLAHSGIDRLIAMLPDADCAAVEAADYNRQAVAEAERVRDFIALHYAVASHSEPFWRERAAAASPPSLEHTMALFRERGRLPFYEEETFSRDSWTTVLLGSGVLPRRIDPLVAAAPRAAVRQAMAWWHEQVTTGARARPTLPAFMAAQHRRLAR